MLRCAQRRRVISIPLQKFTEFGILVGNCILLTHINQLLLVTQEKTKKKKNAYLLDLRQKVKRQHRAKDTQRAGDEERVLAGANRIWRILLRNGNHIRAHKGPNLPRGRCNRVVLSADRSRAALCRAESDVVAGAEFT